MRSRLGGVQELHIRAKLTPEAVHLGWVAQPQTDAARKIRRCVQHVQNTAAALATRTSEPPVMPTLAMDGGGFGVVHLCEAVMDMALDAEIEGDCRARVHRARDGGAAVFAKGASAVPTGCIRVLGTASGRRSGRRAGRRCWW